MPEQILLKKFGEDNLKIYRLSHSITGHYYVEKAEITTLPLHAPILNCSDYENIWECRIWYDRVILTDFLPSVHGTQINDMQIIAS